MRSANPTFFTLERNLYTNRLAFCSVPACYRYGGGGAAAYFGPDVIVNDEDRSSAPVMNRQPLSYRGKQIIGQQCTSSRTTAILYAQPPFLPTLTDDFAGDFTILMLGNPASAGAYTRLFHQGGLDYGGTANLTIMGNATGATSAGVVAGAITFFCYNQGVFTGYGDATSAIDGKPHCFMFRRVGGVHSIYRDGVDITTAQSTASGLTGLYSANCDIVVGGALVSAEEQSANCNIALMVGWNRALSLGEMTALSNDPFKIFGADPNLTTLTSFGIGGSGLFLRALMGTGL